MKKWSVLLSKESQQQLSVLQSTLCIMSSSLVSSMLTVWSLEISSGWSEMSLTSGSGSEEGGGVA
jgi:hypothetical protein